MMSPVLEQTNEVLISAKQYLFARSQNDNDFLLTGGCISFFTKTGFFAALGHNEEPEALSYEGAEVYAQPSDCGDLEQAGRVLRSTPSGIYGAFYDDYAPSAIDKLTIAPLEELKADEPAELWMQTDSDVKTVFHGKIAALFSDKPFPVLFEAMDESFPGATFGCSGSVIVQDGRLAAVVAGGNENPANLLYCTSAEQMIRDLDCMLQDIATAPVGDYDD